MTNTSTFLHFSGIISPFSPFLVKHFLELSGVPNPRLELLYLGGGILALSGSAKVEFTAFLT